MRNILITILMIIILIYPICYGDTLTYQIQTTVVNVTATAAKLPNTALVGRQYIQIQNVGSSTVYIGDSVVTANTNITTGGTQLMPYATWGANYDHTVDVYGIVSSGGCNVTIEEGK